jgi:hypothetical protein
VAQTSPDNGPHAGRQADAHRAGLPQHGLTLPSLLAKPGPIRQSQGAARAPVQTLTVLTRLHPGACGLQLHSQHCLYSLHCAHVEPLWQHHQPAPAHSALVLKRLMHPAGDLRLCPASQLAGQPESTLCRVVSFQPGCRWAKRMQALT